MKILIALTIVLFAPISTYAITGPYDLGGQYNPINVIVTPSASTQNSQKESNLQSAYGISAYNACRSSCSGMIDLANPNNQARCLLYIESCLARYQQPKTVTAPTTNPNSVESRDASCKATYGPTARASGTQGCDLGIPATIKNPVLAAPTPTKTNAQICHDYYGQFSVWTGQMNDQNGPLCGCQDGYAWNSGSTACVPLQPTNKSNNATGTTCDRLVMGEMTHFGLMSADSCFDVWQKAVEAAQKKISNSVTPAVQAESKKIRASTDEVRSAVTPTATSASVARPAAERRTLWAWLISLFK